MENSVVVILGTWPLSSLDVLNDIWEKETPKRWEVLF